MTQAIDLRCRRCGARIDRISTFCARCGTRQGSGPDGATGRIQPGWYADPFERAPRRYFDGTIWTERVDVELGATDTLSFRFDEEGKIPDGAWRATGWSLSFSVIGLAVAFGLSFLFILPFLLLGHPGGALAGLALSETGLWLGLFGTCVVASGRYGTGSVRADFRISFRWLDVAIGLGAAFTARFVAAAVLLPFEHLAQRAGNPDRSLYDIVRLGSGGWAVLVLLTCVGAPLFEELYFRGLLQGQLTERYGPVLAVLLTSIVFGSAHIANDPGVGGLLLALSVGASGLVLGAVRHLTRRLGTSMVTHSMFNGFAILALWALTTR